MFGVNLSALLDSLDTVAKETLEEPKESATRIRSKRKQASQNNNDQIIEEDGEAVGISLDEDASNHAKKEDSVDHSPSSSRSTGLPLDEGSTHSNRTQESYVIPNGSLNSNSLHGSEDALKDHVSVKAVTSLPANMSAEAVTSTIAAASKLIVPAVTNVLSKKSSSSLASNLSENATSSANTASGDSELRKQLRAKSKEIESLNEECLELEEQVTSLKQEVQEAWDQYKLAQERAASREAELQEEINILQKVKQTDKLNSVGQITKLNEDIELILQQLQQLREEKQSVVSQLAEQDSIRDGYEAKIRTLEEELKESRINSMQGAHHLREEVKQLQIQRDYMTEEHNRLLKQLQSRQSQLEQENAQLGMTLANNQQEILRLKQNGGANSGSAASGSNGGTATNEEYMNREIVSLRQELTTLQTQFDNQADQKQALEVQLRQVERDFRVLQMTYDDYRQRTSDNEINSQQKLQQLESQLAQYRQTVNNSNANTTTHDFNSGSIDLHSYKELKQQVEHLSKMLMKKQSDLVDISAERTTLKSKILDLQAKCSSLETQLTQARDLEDGDDDYSEDYSGSGTGFQRAGHDRLMHRRGRGGMGSGGSGNEMTRVSNAKVISDLERIGVKPNASVTKAVTMIDSFALCTGKFLRSNPLIRLAFVMYLVLLHLWVFFILIIHTHALELPADPRDRVQNKLFKAPMAPRSVSSLTT